MKNLLWSLAVLVGGTGFAASFDPLAVKMKAPKDWRCNPTAVLNWKCDVPKISQGAILQIAFAGVNETFTLDHLEGVVAQNGSMKRRRGKKAEWIESYGSGKNVSPENASFSLHTVVHQKGHHMLMIMVLAEKAAIKKLGPALADAVLDAEISPFIDDIAAFARGETGPAGTASLVSYSPPNPLRPGPCPEPIKLSFPSDATEGIRFPFFAGVVELAETKRILDLNIRATAFYPTEILLTPIQVGDSKVIVRDRAGKCWARVHVRVMPPSKKTEPRVPASVENFRFIHP